jgi:uncharacterized protein (TIGR02145 family)
VDTTGKYGSFLDERDGIVYRTLDIKLKDGDTATWMASLLEYDTQNGDDTCYESRSEIKGISSYMPGVGRGYTPCQIFGLSIGEECELGSMSNSKVVLKNPINLNESVQGICPDGWHIPNIQEWDKMADAIEDNIEMRELMRFLQYHDPEQSEVYRVSFYENYTLDTGDMYYYAGEGNGSRVNDPKIYLSPIRDMKLTLVFGGDGVVYGLRCVKD